MDNTDLEKKIKDMEDRIRQLETRRILQQDLMPDCVKSRHISEGVRYIRGGITANKPTSGEEPAQGYAVYFDETTNKLYVWNRSSDTWKSATLT